MSYIKLEQKLDLAAYTFIIRFWINNTGNDVFVAKNWHNTGIPTAFPNERNVAFSKIDFDIEIKNMKKLSQLTVNKWYKSIKNFNTFDQIGMFYI